MITIIPGSTVVAECTFFDEDGDPITPVSVNWQLTDGDGTAIANGTETPNGTVSIVLHGTQLAASSDTRRRLIVSGTYLSTLSVSPLEYAEAVEFDLGYDV